jgi:K+-transporting ATPase ATPase A chain
VNVPGWIQIAAFAAVVLAVTKPLGAYMYRVFEGPPERRPFRRALIPLERGVYRLIGVDPSREQDWKAYTCALLGFSAVSVLVVFALQRWQALLPLNPESMGSVAPDLAFNTAVSFTTNTNWQAYGGESTMSYLTQMAGLTWQNFVSAAAGVAVALALARGITRRLAPGAPRTIGNFWGDLVRATLYVLLPISFLAALFFVSQGVIQNLSPYATVTTVEGATQRIALGPTASQLAIKILGTNGGGFFNANSAHPFENPTPLTNFVEMALIFAIPAGLTYTYGRMARSQRQGWALLAAMFVLFGAGVVAAYAAESGSNPALNGIAYAGSGNLEGKEARFGVGASALFATITTGASCGAVNSMHDSFTPLGGLVLLTNILLGEVVFGGVGAGLYGILVFALLAVFLAGLMVGRTPELLGKKIEAKEVQLAVLYVLVFPLFILVFTGISLAVPAFTKSIQNAGPHGLTEVLYAFSSAGGNNGSAFAGLSANTRWFNWALGFTMLAGRFLMIVPVLGLAGALVGKKVHPPGAGTFPTGGVSFVVLLTAVIVIVGALTFFPVLALGPILEHFAASAGKAF